ncbi:MAG: PilZ domain-containing protein, partial [Candidatus Omnitrophica bacterium]|nr:PilZ domain-containing protein [Candidatus Omnitrophota bacterium]
LTTCLEIIHAYDTIGINNLYDHRLITGGQKMSSAEDKRRFMRLGAFLEGTFQTEVGKKGLIMLTNFSREGLKTCLNRKLDIGSILNIEIWIPGSIIPVFAQGLAVWIKKGDPDWTYPYDAGIRVVEIDQEDRERILDFAYSHWRNARGKL